MANNQTGSPSTSDNQANNVGLRVIALAHSTNQNEDLSLVLDLGTTVGRLKEELQRKLSQHPRPETQRLIYQGRPLTDSSATLRQILRLEPTTSVPAPPHVLHLVVRDDQSTIPATMNRSQSATSQTASTTAASSTQERPNPTLSAFDAAQHAFPQGHPAQAMLHHAMHHHAMQHQMALQNQHQHNTNFHQPPFPIPTPHPPQFSRPENVPNQQPIHDNSEQSAGTNSSSATGSGAIGNSMPPPHTTTEISGIGRSVSVEETIGPNGERIRRVIHNGHPLPGQHPIERTASAPGAGARLSRPHTPVRSALSQSPLPAILPRVPLPQFQPRFGAPVHMPFGNINLGPVQHAIQPREPLVYLISSPTGPEALLFTPNHGYFSTHQPSPTTQPMHQTQSSSNDTLNPPLRPTPTQPAPQNTAVAARNNQPDQVALRPQAAAPGQAQLQPGRRDGEDVIAQVLQRSWLFLRLYMFIFVLSEPGTWRRYILLLIASLVCLLPRNNPFTDLFQAARRHFDNLIGPPQPPAQPQRAPTQNQQAERNNANENVGGSGTASPETVPRHRSTDARMPTPEEHARRLLRNQQERNPNPIRDTLYRIEQAVVLFLASLIPGVGERHVRAREEARRIMQEEADRRRREAEERNQEQNREDANKSNEAQTASASSPRIENSDSAVATSTGIDTGSSHETPASTANEGLRMRGSDANVQAS